MFQMDLPNDVIKEFETIYKDCDEILGAMTQAGAQTALANVRANAPASFRNSGIMNCLKITKVYKTPSDDGINSKVGFFGYFVNEEGRRVPAPLVANVFEYGRSTSKFPKQPFFRKSFRKDQIEAAMLKAQKEKSGGLLE
jgi:hypothetical protein